MKKIFNKIVVFVMSFLMVFTLMTVTGCSNGTNVIKDGSLQLTSFNVSTNENVVKKSNSRKMRNMDDNSSEIVEDTDSYYALLNDEQPTLVAVVKNDKNLVFFEMDVKMGDVEVAFTPWSNTESTKVTVDKQKVDDIWTTYIYITPDIAVTTYDAKETLTITNLIFFNVSDVEVDENSTDKYSKVGAYIDSAPKAVTFYKYVGADSTAYFTPVGSFIKYGIKYDTTDERYEATVSVNENYSGDAISELVVPETIELDILTRNDVENDSKTHITATITALEDMAFSEIGIGDNVGKIAATLKLTLPDTLEYVGYFIGKYITNLIPTIVENGVSYVGSTTNPYLVAYTSEGIDGVLTLNARCKFANNLDCYKATGFAFTAEPEFLTLNDNGTALMNKDKTTVYEFAFSCSADGKIIELPESVNYILVTEQFYGITFDISYSNMAGANTIKFNSTTAPEFYSREVAYIAKRFIVPRGTVSNYYNCLSKTMSKTHFYEDMGNYVATYTADYGIQYALYDGGYAEVSGYTEFVDSEGKITTINGWDNNRIKDYSYVIDIPETISYEGVNYTVEAVAPKALEWTYPKAIIYPGTMRFASECGYHDTIHIFKETSVKENSGFLKTSYGKAYAPLSQADLFATILDAGNLKYYSNYDEVLDLLK